MAPPSLLGIDNKKKRNTRESYPFDRKNGIDDRKNE